MTHFKENENPNACIVGSNIIGDRNKANPQDSFVRIFGFSCEVKDCNDRCIEIAQMTYGDIARLELHWDIKDSISGNRGIVEPADGYSGPGLRSKGKKKPRKGGTHVPNFSVNGIPAVCYFDNIETGQRPINLARIRIVELQ